MSLVGPRAYYPDELENQQKEHPNTKKYVSDALSVKPGITGLWQVTGRSEINFDKRIAIDARYVHNISLGEDFKIILQTPLVMINGAGLYEKIHTFIFFLFIIAVAGALYFVAYIPAMKIKAKGNAVLSAARDMKQVFSKNDIDLLNSKMKGFVQTYTEFENESKTVYWASFIPYVADFKRGVEAGATSSKPDRTRLRPSLLMPT